MNTLDLYFEKGIEKGMEKGIRKGRKEGIEKGKEQIILNLINTGKFTLPEISNLAGVPESLVKKIVASMKKN